MPTVRLPLVSTGCIGTFANGLPDVEFKCLKNFDPITSQPVYVCTGKRFFFVTCARVNRQCSQVSGAFVAAVTVCNQRLF